MTTEPLQVWTSGENGSPVCQFTRINLVAAEAANTEAIENEEDALAEFINGNKARESVQPAGVMGLLTGRYDDFQQDFFTREGAALLMQSPVWNPGGP